MCGLRGAMPAQRTLGAIDCGRGCGLYNLENAVLKNMAKKSAAGKLTYAEAVAGIEDILTRLRSEQIGVDELAQQVARATELIAFCKGRLYDAETAVQGVLSKDDSKDSDGKKD